ncbi:MAG: sulfite exporter TauE/SafE family protein, partial [Dehalococcoidia bacterium]|nr:sulfite exporter TauE/SafE family protein [Dehalococcoidia bacterium]
SLAPATLAGTWIGTRLLDRIPARVFLVLVEAGLVVAGTLLIVRG